MRRVATAVEQPLGRVAQLVRKRRLETLSAIEHLSGVNAVWRDVGASSVVGCSLVGVRRCE